PTKSGDGEVGNHGLSIAPFAALLNGRKASIEQSAEFNWSKDLDLAAVDLGEFDGPHFIVVFGQVPAFDGEAEEGVDQLPMVVLRAAGNFKAADVILDLFAADDGDTDTEAFGELAQTSEEFLCVHLALAGLLLGLN